MGILMTEPFLFSASLNRDDCKEAWITRAAALISTSREQQALDEMTK
jgi:hypothetical protein